MSTVASSAGDTPPPAIPMNSLGADPLAATLYSYAVRTPVAPELTDKQHQPVAHADGSVSLVSVTDFLRHRGRAVRGPDDVMRALRARGVAAGRMRHPQSIDSFTSRVLCLPTGNRWHEAVSTALLSDWTAPLERNGRITFDVIGTLRAEAQTLHRQLVPLWRRRPRGSRGSRTLLLDTLIGAELTLYDLLAGCPSTEDITLGAGPEDPRIARVLAQLRPEERMVALAWAHPAVASWTEAAAAAGAPDPGALGERVRRKLKRLGARHKARARAARPPIGIGRGASS
ncbi:hypothetical protein [Streptomyces sp.]|uniref:hypothetical protein n=1 Tax=Streptomyces sp. TaxID=1931 RepID=UPI002D79B886|nr:hypothetical protein [Streptomyces sp.]HET6354626.1 hypothetical protein [Streptomyces sp.]